MNIVINALIGLIAGYIVGVILAAIVAFVFDLPDAARFVAIAFGLLGAVAGPSVFGRLREDTR